ncbi:hypothetical protein PDE_02280 [Penicillium oxalicum 114-2]|uniref:Uncharacterized protein n=1 Tax=Penicillium oxalicum (strain 114-2 / CGMCC 5302) TaxID=933388 RepID=S8AZD3_PENO1|nr:hypothetical protein PDE_02280 [Penicillium oxalicum 114-2]
MKISLGRQRINQDLKGESVQSTHPQIQTRGRKERNGEQAFNSERERGGGEREGKIQWIKNRWRCVEKMQVLKSKNEEREEGGRNWALLMESLVWSRRMKNSRMMDPDDASRGTPQKTERSVIL